MVLGSKGMGRVPMDSLADPKLKECIENCEMTSTNTYDINNLERSMVSSGGPTVPSGDQKNTCVYRCMNHYHYTPRNELIQHSSFPSLL